MSSPVERYVAPRGSKQADRTQRSECYSRFHAAVTDLLAVVESTNAWPLCTPVIRMPTSCRRPWTIMDDLEERVFGELPDDTLVLPPARK